jgi:hypothetical protein
MGRDVSVNLQREQQAFGRYQQATQQQQQTAREHLANQVRDTVNDWESKVAQSDPDYAAKKPLCRTCGRSSVKGVPQSPAHAVQVRKKHCAA